MSFEALAHEITDQLVADVKADRHLRYWWDQIEHSERAKIIDRWRALILAICHGDAERVVARYLTQGLGPKEALETAADALRKQLESSR